MKEEIIIAGFGGQGVLSMGKILAYSGLMEGKEVTWMPAYGPEQRGGTANVTVSVSDEKISSPILSKYDAAIILNQPSLGMKTSTSPYGRDVHLHGYPLKMADIAAQLEGTAYVTRQSVDTVPAIRKAKKAIRKAFENSMAGKGSNLVEIVSTCNSGWKMSPEKSNKWMQEHMFPFYPLGDLKDKQ